MNGRRYFLVILLLTPVASSAATDVRLLLPLHRQAYQTNEWIDVSVLRSADHALAAGDLVLTALAADGGKVVATFPVDAVDLEQGNARRTEHLHLDGRLLRPGDYTLTAACDGLTSPPQAIDVHSHLRRSTFKLIDWGSRAAGREQRVLGEQSLGFNLDLVAYGGLSPDDLIRGGVDFMWNCTMSGGSQMDLRQECDWSDPYVLGGGVARVSRRALADRTLPNCLGVHIYDEPTLTRLKHAGSNEPSPFNVPAQDRAYRATFGDDPPRADALDPNDAQASRRFTEMNRWRLSLLEAAWRVSNYGITDVRRDFLAVNQSAWFWNAFGLGYYFNHLRALPVFSGHGGYDYHSGGDFTPGYFFEFGRARDYAKPNWYLPMWSSGRPDLWRCEQNLSFINNLQGMAKPPDVLAHRPSKADATAGVVETNRAMERLGTVFTTMPVTVPEVAVLWPLSANLHDQVRDRRDISSGNGRFEKLLYVYMGSKLAHIPIFPVVEEDVLDGSVAAHHKVILLVGVDYLDPNVASALRAFITGGGAVLLSDDSTLDLPGAKRISLALTAGVALSHNQQTWAAAGDWEDWNHTVVSNGFYKAARPVAQALKDALLPLGVRPLFGSDQPGLVGSRQAQGDVEYLFAVNATPNLNLFEWYSLAPVTANLTLPADGRPVYDALDGGMLSAPWQTDDGVVFKFRFGPGQLRAFARTARPIGGVQLLTPDVVRDTLRPTDPIHVDVRAVVVDEQQRTLCGAIPMNVRLTDPLGVIRYDLLRATDKGLLQINLPLAANDSRGEWTLLARELLSNTETKATFRYDPPPQCGAIAGATHRAVFFGNDRENIFRFFRRHKDVTIIPGSSDFDAAQAQRLATILQPWDVRAKIVPAADAAKPRPITPDEAPTWAGLAGGRVEAGSKNNPASVGFDVRGPVVLLGNPDDHPLIKFLHDNAFLPYAPARDEFPGRGRGMLAWQTNGVGYFNQESITAIAYDAAGMSEAVGSLYEALAGLDPLTPLRLPTTTILQPATTSLPVAPEPKPFWRQPLGDRIAALRPLPDGGCVALTEAGVLTTLTRAGEIAWQKTLDGGEAWALDVSPDGTRIVVGATQQIVAFDAAGQQLFSTPLGSGNVVPRVSFVTVAPDGKSVAAGASLFLWTGKTWHWGSRLMLLAPDGKPRWSLGGADPATGAESLPEQYVAGRFSADGSTLLVFTPDRAHLVDTAAGKFGPTLDHVTGKIPPVQAGPNLLVTDAAGTLATISPADGAPGAKITAPPELGIVAFAPTADGVIVGTESDGTVRRLKLREGNLADLTRWQHAEPALIVKEIRIHGDACAVTYWGGSLRVLDAATGATRFAARFPQDVAALTWTDNALVLGLANGELISLDVPH